MLPTFFFIERLCHYPSYVFSPLSTEYNFLDQPLLSVLPAPLGL